MVIDRHQQIIDELTSDAIKLMSDWPSAREKQKQFVLAFVASGFKNATEAARQAGYSDKTAKVTSSQILTKPNFFHVQEVIKILKGNFDKRSTELSIASLVEIKQFHTRVLRGEETDFEVVPSVDGTTSIEEVPPRIRERQKSADSLVKMLSDSENVNRTELALEKLFDKLEEEINGN
ncbi:Terminase small subunit [Streptococcus suis]|uniref:terminase small subunit n=1 Tax=Streptococcus suis TaxID=1307 RepID=UPI0002B788F6|nr:terminase small subunit [Streptococcus suis]AGF87677.1 putative phage terminase small subunit [Streptococcus phage phiS10]MBS0737583.1 terminase small subunit [Streptococcus suis]MBS0739500.1 terminase small subunit [Streptococcus suis]MBS0741418.1 terminase small subunit [Streptococcus suis]MBS0747180.1 terminase small subunit [Streptococcus suis]